MIFTVFWDVRRKAFSTVLRRNPALLFHINEDAPTKSRRRPMAWSSMAALGLAACLFAAPAQAAENATSFFLGGAKGPMAGVTPPPGIFVSNNVYIYSGSANPSLEVPVGGKIVAGVDADLVLDMPTFLWVTGANVLGGRLAFAATIPFGGLDMKASIEYQTPHGTPGRGIEDDVTTIADPVMTSFIGWEAGNFHWQTGVSVNVPIGDYQKGDFANFAIHPCAADFFAAGTWLDPSIGLDVSGVLGFTVNGTNHATDYTTGDEFHAEFAVSQHLTKDFTLGVAGFYYNQVTGDSGTGAKLGDFEGRTAGIGGTLGYTFYIGPAPVVTSLRYYHEFDVKNRLSGDVGVISISMPLWVPGH
jgi:hypothetical protein